MDKDARATEQATDGSAGELAGLRVAILAETLYEDLELWYPYYRLREAGADVFVVGSGSAETYQSKHGYPVTVDAEADTVTASQFDAVIIPGGYSPDHMRRHPGMVKLVREAHEQGKVVAAICHAGWMLASANIVRGRTATSFRSIKDDMVNAGANWVDREVVRDGSLVTSRSPADLPAFMRRLLPVARERGITLITNAGGMNATGAATAVRDVARELDMADLRVATVTGDDVTSRIDDLRARGAQLSNLDTGADIDGVRDRVVFAVAYLGAAPIVEALQRGADVVVTGRVADASLFVAPMVHELGWSFEDWDRLAAGVVLGHLMECSGQATGGNFSGDWQNIADHQACCAHLIRDFEDAAESWPDAIWPIQAQRALRGLIPAWHTARHQGLPEIPSHLRDPLAGPVRTT